MSEHPESFTQEFRGKERDHRGYDVLVPADGSQPFSVPRYISEVRFTSAWGDWGDLGPLAVTGSGPKVISIIDETRSAGPQLIGASADYKASHGNPDNASALTLNDEASARFECIAQELAGIFLDEIKRQWSGPFKETITISLNAIKNNFSAADVFTEKQVKLNHAQRAYAA